jgi:hypothetical protein
MGTNSCFYIKVLNLFSVLVFNWSYLDFFFEVAARDHVENRDLHRYPTITYYWTVSLILDHSYLVGNLTHSKIAETKALEPLKS